MDAGLFLLGFFVGILVLLILVTVHEFGHFIIAKLSGAYVYEFAIGFGPRLFTFKGKETWVSIRIFPLGGFCSIASEKVDPPSDREDVDVPPERYMDYIARWKKLLFILFGPLMNLFVAIFLFTIIFAATQSKLDDMSFYGAKYGQNQIAYKLINEKALEVEKEKDSSLTKENFSIDQSYVIWGWKLVANSETSTDGQTKSEQVVLFNNIDNTNPELNNEKINDSDNQQAATYEKTVYNFINNLTLGKEKEGLQIQFSFKHVDKFSGRALDGYNSPIVTRFSTSDEYNKDSLSVGIAPPIRYYANSSIAYLAGWKETFTQSISILKSIGMIFTGSFSNLSGPVGVATQTANMLGDAHKFFLYVAMISANLFIINLIFIPPLDGYKVIEIIIEMIIRKELSQKYKIIVYSIGAILFLTIFATVTILDFIRG
ncbi:inner membrane zinc metalloprotease [Spiroplasma helicoides]|uniref:Zinc metalloprotease n=1 Tax=Spiroplasma helicoides TaxID=216938 RepID=A0A1B3SL19_9MOLU|nr:RIP metalloprotease RseP [Spiroplasma helicoides]AOG60632.1 inner membrane zinc metalloprotease [Spiroplasma helicoides]